MLYVKWDGLDKIVEDGRNARSNYNAALVEMVRRAAIAVRNDAADPANWGHALDNALVEDVDRFFLRKDGTRRFALKGHWKHYARAGAPNPPPGPLRNLSGALRRSIDVEIRTPLMGVVVGIVGTDSPYGRIHEIGGRAGRGRRSAIPPRPYLGPALERMEAQVFETLGLVPVYAQMAQQRRAG